MVTLIPALGARGGIAGVWACSGCVIHWERLVWSVGKLSGWGERKASVEVLLCPRLTCSPSVPPSVTPMWHSHYEMGCPLQTFWRVRSCCCSRACFPVSPVLLAHISSPFTVVPITIKQMGCGLCLSCMEKGQRLTFVFWK